MAQVIIQRASFASLLIEPRVATNAGLATATGFIVDRKGSHYLVTNWHVVSGRRTDTGQPLASTGAVPERLAIAHNVKGKLGTWTVREEPLYDGSGKPLWREHAKFGRKVDVVVLPLTQEADVDFYPYDPWSPGPGLAVAVTTGVSIVGFPFGVTGGGAAGVWVRGWIATEPSLDFDGRPAFLVDSRTRPGQSGAPVIVFQSGGAVAMADGGTTIYGGAVEEFLGVYSGRINDQSDLGYVWKASALQDIIDNGVPGTT